MSERDAYDREGYRREAERALEDARWSAGRVIFKIILPAMIAVVLLGIVGNALGWFGEAAQVAREQFSPREMLRKYEQFKDMKAQLDKKKADIAVFEGRVKAQDEAYTGVARKDWPRDEREQRSVWESEVAGVKASFNSLAADYNANMAKFNWRFANQGMLPEGATEPLPREFAPYVAQ